jgi:hypothetical protein
MELLEHQVTIWVQAVLTELHEIAIRHLIEMVQEIPTKMRSYSLFPRSSVSAFPAQCTMRSPHSLLREYRCWKTDFLWQIEHN